MLNAVALTPTPLPCPAKMSGAKHCPPPVLTQLNFKNNAEVINMLKMGNITDAVLQAIRAGQVVCGAQLPPT